MNAESKFMTFHNETGKDFFKVIRINKKCKIESIVIMYN